MKLLIFTLLTAVYWAPHAYATDTSVSLKFDQHWMDTDEYGNCLGYTVQFYPTVTGETCNYTFSNEVNISFDCNGTARP
jgi:hypothetical protein